MTKDFQAQLTWFTKKLLQIRLTDVRGYNLSIPFRLLDIQNCTAVEFGEERTAKEHLGDLVEEIRGFYMRNSTHVANRNDIVLELPRNGRVIIHGIDSELLNLFLIKHLETSTSLLETRAGGALFFVELDTGIRLNATEQNILARLRTLKEKGGVLYYNDIFEIIASHKGVERTVYIQRNSTEEQQNVAARGAISGLLSKIKSLPSLSNLESEQIIKNERGEGYKLMI